MKTLIALAAFALAAGTVGSQACDYQHNAANATPIVVATTEQSTAQQPVTTPEPAVPTVSTTDSPPTTAAYGGCAGANC